MNVSVQEMGGRTFGVTLDTPPENGGDPANPTHNTLRKCEVINGVGRPFRYMRCSRGLIKIQNKPDLIIT